MPQSSSIGPLNFRTLSLAAGGLLFVLGGMLFLGHVGRVFTGKGLLDGFPIENNIFTSYLGATAGATWMAWSLILIGSAKHPSVQPLIAVASGVGFALLAGMRMLALVSATLRMMDIRVLIVEVIIFSAISAGFFMLRANPGSADSVVSGSNP